MLDLCLWPALHLGTMLPVGEASTFALKSGGRRSNAAWTMSHLDKVPLTIRGAGIDHLPAFMQLQLTAAPSLQVCFSLTTGVPSPSS